MPTVPSDSPSVHDLHTDATAGFSGLPDDAMAEIDEHFHYDSQPTDEDLEAMYADWQERQIERTCFANLQPLPELHPVRRAIAKLNPAAWPQLKSA